MRSRFLRFASLGLLVFAFGGSFSPGALKAAIRAKLRPDGTYEPSKGMGAPSRSNSQAVQQLAGSAISFSERRERASGQIQFVAHGSNPRVSIDPSKTILEWGTTAAKNAKERPHDNRNQLKIGILLVEGNPGSALSGRDETAEVRSADKGNHGSSQGRYKNVRIAQSYPGIDVMYHGDEGQLEYDFIVSSHSDPRKIKVAFDGIDSMDLDSEGNLILRAGDRELSQRKPSVYQLINGTRREIGSGYVLLGKNQVAFELAPYDKNYQLVIDPVLAYSAGK